jgi:hypothetical protein
MSLNYARELLKISISQLCLAIGFDTTSQIAIDILVDICERQFQYLAKQTSNLVNEQPNFKDILLIILNNNENLRQLEDFIKQFQSIRFSNDIIQFPYRKRNQFYLRIPSKNSEQVFERDQDQTTEYIYDWLPLFPDQETPEQPSTINLDTNLDANVYYDQDRKFDKDGSHHPLTLLSFLSKIGDEPNVVPIGKRPNRSLPSILYRPRRIMEIEAAVAAAEKAKKEQQEKENVEKDQQQNSQPPLRLTISKPLVTNDKTSLIKKLPTNLDGILQKKPASTSSLNSNSSSINLGGKKFLISPPINETHSQPNISTNVN